MRKSFNEDVLRKWFFYNTRCWVCGKNTWDSFHHVINGSDSILNAAPVCNETCHLAIHGILRKKEKVIVLLRKTLEYLLDQGYVFNKNDKIFIEKHRSYYEGILKNKKARICMTLIQ